ncbi:MAG TPA: DUF1707 domain-containing protein [Chloroflexota bacterium]|nr:DUF1707 domain-containing protein [Chloroflexota bacterium]
MERAMMRTAEADRRAAVAELQRHFVAGRLDDVELGERVRQALGARTFGELEALLQDLPRDVPAPAAPPAERDRPRHPHGLAAHVVTYLVVMIMLTAIWLLTTPGEGGFWPLWPALGWGLGLLAHARRHHQERLAPRAAF